MAAEGLQARAAQENAAATDGDYGCGIVRQHASRAAETTSGAPGFVHPGPAGGGDNRPQIAGSAGPPSAEAVARIDDNERIMKLERELWRTEERLRARSRELAATIEMLRSAQDRLAANDDRLQHANDRLRHANEAVHSLNEELAAVNAAFQSQIRELSELRDDMVNFFESTQIGMVLLDRHLCIRRFTPAITKEINLLEIDCGRPLAHLSHNFGYDRLVEAAADVLEKQTPFEKVIRSKRGVWYNLHIMPYRTTGGEVSGVVLSFVDITELKLYNEELLKLSYALEQSPSLVMITDVKGTVEYVNPTFVETTGFTSLDIRGRRLESLSNWSLADDSYHAVLCTLQAGKVWKGELESVRIDGTYYRESAKLVPITDNDGRTIHYLKLSEDITGLRHAEQMLQKNEMLSAMGQLAAGIAHEIRNPLTSLKGFTKLIASGVAKDSYTDIMMNELSRIELIVGELLVLAKPQVLDFAYKEADVILRDVVMLLESQAHLNNVEILCNFEEHLPPIRCVENQIKQVFINMIKNGIEAMPAGGRISIRAELGADRYLHVRFSDNGPGIPESKLARLGQPFFTTKEKGTGLGLTVCYKIMDNHQGAIRFESEVGRGTRVTVSLPVHD
ncbi:ATP-binding protein [Cohnella sp. 56]|uniref:ATP-binding protein n=1 Tax=Cohnella sp. 56 TaxID=3113722 RepID=UPI0030E785EE